jgi:hypothetical protein
MGLAQSAVGDWAAFAASLEDHAYPHIGNTPDAPHFHWQPGNEKLRLGPLPPLNDLDAGCFCYISIPI